MNGTPKKIALVTGGNRGIGLEICRGLGKKGLKVLLGSRDEKKGKTAAEELRKLNYDVEFLSLDVTENKSIQNAFNEIEKKFGRLDVLVNNAGVFLDDYENSTAFKADPEIIKRTFATNTVGPFVMCQTFIPLMQRNKYGRVVNISSGMGQLSEMNGGFAGYRLSKTALNAVTRIFAEETADSNVLVNSMCPGWVKTDMGGPGAERTVEHGAETALWLATLPDGSASGQFFRDKEPIAW